MSSALAELLAYLHERMGDAHWVAANEQLVRRYVNACNELGVKP